MFAINYGIEKGTKNHLKVDYDQTNKEVNREFWRVCCKYFSIFNRHSFRQPEKEH